jgi:hypothetical protein
MSLRTAPNQPSRNVRGKKLPTCTLVSVCARRMTFRLALASLILLFLPWTITGVNAAEVHWPPGFDFASSIESEEYSLPDFYDTYLANALSDANQSDYGLALSNLTIGLEKRDALYLGYAKSLFRESFIHSDNATQKALAKAGMTYVDDILSNNLAKKTASTETVLPVTIKKSAPPRPGFKKIILGLSAIHVSRNTKIKTQVDRVTRDWLQGFNVKNAPWALDVDHAATWHEGKKIQEIVALSGAKASVVTGTVAKRIGDDWYAPDASGRYRFKIAEDKVLNFPTNFVVDDHTAILNDTHGISALAWNALDANLVIGCGDAPGKMEAAYYLAENGVNVYTPTDRLIGMLIGSEGKGTVVGSAPVKKSGSGAVIGDQPVKFAVDETIVVSYTKGHYPLQYYDTPYRYFKALEEYIRQPLKIVPVEVVKYGNADIVVEKARQIGANLIGIRVWGKQEHDAVAAWLKESAEHRAVLFHTSVYPEGYRLFFEFPHQTSFGDIHPKFEY